MATRMGGSGATDDLEQAHLTQAWLAVGDTEAARGTGGYYYRRSPGQVHAAVDDTELQDRLLAYCREQSGVTLG